MKELVIDISHWDEDINLQQWKDRRGLWGVIIKAGGNESGLGRYTDPRFEKNYSKAKAAGLHIGFYYYTVTTSIGEAKKDGDHFADLIGDKDYDLPCYMDVEDPAQFQLSRDNLTNVIKSFCDTLNNRGYYAGLYTGGSAWLHSVNNQELIKYANWIAWWKATWPNEAGDIGMWQQGTMRLSDGQIFYDDVSGCTDVDWCVIDYPSIIKNQTSSKNKTKEESSPREEKKTVNGTAADVINAAYGELGYYAPNDPERGSKYGRWMAELTGEDWLAGPSTEIWWCCMFVSWCLNQGGVVMKGFPSANTDVALDGGAINYQVDKYSVQYGDIIIYNWDWDSATDHIGFATGSWDGTGFPAIEGNISNAVKELYRQMGNVAYVLRPPYNGNIDIPSTPAPNVDTSPKNNRDGGTLDVDGIGGWNTIIDWQHQLGSYEDGSIDGQILSNKKYHSAMGNINYDDGGSSLVKKIQQKVGVEADGYWGKDTSKAIQQWLVNQGYDIGPDGVDGYFGRNSVKALQQSLNDKKW